MNKFETSFERCLNQCWWSKTKINIHINEEEYGQPTAQAVKRPPPCPDFSLTCDPVALDNDGNVSIEVSIPRKVRPLLQ